MRACVRARRGLAGSEWMKALAGNMELALAQGIKTSFFSIVTSKFTLCVCVCVRACVCVVVSYTLNPCYCGN